MFSFDHQNPNQAGQGRQTEIEMSSNTQSTEEGPRRPHRIPFPFRFSFITRAQVQRLQLHFILTNLGFDEESIANLDPSLSGDILNNILLIALMGEGQNPQTEPAGLTKKEIDELPLSKYETKEAITAGQENSKKICTVCLECFENGQDVRIFKCNHIFHQKCIDKWLEIQNFCPNCKSLLHFDH